MLASMAVENGWAGLVINGCIRDSKIINELDIGVKALGTHPLKSIKNFKGERGIRVTFAGVEFVPGQWLYSDEVSCILITTCTIVSFYRMRVKIYIMTDSFFVNVFICFVTQDGIIISEKELSV